MSNSSAYSSTEVRLHWIIGVLMAGQFLLYDRTAGAWKARLDGAIPNKPFPNPHAIVGIVILRLTLWRIA